MIGQQRNIHIDFLRGLAILSVLILHFNLSYELNQSLLTKIFSVDFVNLAARNGNYGVTMFFVISGFLITTMSLERYGKLKDIKVINFYIYRLARIMPCLLLALALIALFNLFPMPIFKNNPNAVSLGIAMLSVLTFWHNILMQKVGYFNYCLNIYWSLSVEEVFYLSFPLLCVALKKIRYVVLVCCLLIIVAPIYRYLHHSNEIVALYGYFSCFDAIAIGCCGAIFASKLKLTLPAAKLIEISAWAMLVSVYFYSGIMQNIVIGVSLVALSTVILLVIKAEDTSNQHIRVSMAKRSIAWLGKNSYELYLFHIIVLALMKEIYPRGVLNDLAKLLWFTLFLILSMLISAIIARYYSIPINRKLREYFLIRANRNTEVVSQILV